MTYKYLVPGTTYKYSEYCTVVLYNYDSTVPGKWGKPFLSLRVRTLLHASHRLQTDAAPAIFYTI
jgi:hypothetical protein